MLSIALGKLFINTTIQQTEYTLKRQIRTQLFILIFFLFFEPEASRISPFLKFSPALAFLTSFNTVLCLHTQYYLLGVRSWFLFLYDSKMLCSPKFYH